MDGASTSLSLDWLHNEDDVNEFILVEPKSTKKKDRMSPSVIGKPVTRSQKKKDTST